MNPSPTSQPVDGVRELTIRLQLFADNYFKAKTSDAPSMNMAAELRSMHDYIEALIARETKAARQVDGNTSDGYHTFNELYRYRMLYNAAFFNELYARSNDYKVHKSLKHHDGELCFGGGWFIVMAYLNGRQISNHYEVKDWDLFQIPEHETADEWDGHTPEQVAERLEAYLLITAPQQEEA